MTPRIWAVARRGARLRTLVEAKLAELTQTVQLDDSGRRTAALDVLRTGRASALTGQVRAQVQFLVSRSNALVTDQRTRAAAEQQLATWATIAAAVASGALLGLLGLLVQRFRRGEIAWRSARDDAERALVEVERLAATVPETATTLQRALLPQKVLNPPGVAVATRYRGASGHENIGGDWYDTIALPDGALALVIGDVEGHDLTAASVMGLVRGAMRSYALEGHPPSVVVEQVNTFLLSTDIERLVTLAYVQLYPEDRILTATLAGHPAPGRPP
jgi:serine phosphatase RsbU (regulator of sigma subunit)